MAPPKGNKFWEARSSHGRNPAFKESDDIWDACCQYFNWVHDNPLEEAIVYQGELNEKQAKPLMRAMTLQGMCRYIGIGTSTWSDYRHKDDFSAIVKEVDDILYDQKFSGAAAGLLNPNIIARDLGLTDKQSQEHSGPDGGPQEHKWTVEVVNAPSDTE